MVNFETQSARNESCCTVRLRPIFTSHIPRAGLPLEPAPMKNHMHYLYIGTNNATSLQMHYSALTRIERVCIDLDPLLLSFNLDMERCPFLDTFDTCRVVEDDLRRLPLGLERDLLLRVEIVAFRDPEDDDAELLPRLDIPLFPDRLKNDLLLLVDTLSSTCFLALDLERDLLERWDVDASSVLSSQFLVLFKPRNDRLCFEESSLSSLGFDFDLVPFTDRVVRRSREVGISSRTSSFVSSRKHPSDLFGCHFLGSVLVLRTLFDFDPFA